MPPSTSKQKIRILMLDDDPIISGFYREILVEQGCEVTLVHQVSDLMRNLLGGQTWNAVVLDIMMPHADWPALDYVKTDDGLLTGVFVARMVRTEMPEVLIIILTNRVPKVVMSHLEEIVPSNDIKSKREFPPFDFADFIKQRV